MNGNKNLGQGDSYSAESETLVPQGERTYTVVGICQTPRFEEDSAPGYAVITTSDAAETADDFSLFVTLKNPREVHAYASNSAEKYAYVFNDNVLRFMGLSDDNVFNMFLYSVGGVVVVIIMIGSIFLIYNAFNISLNERTHRFGILSSVVSMVTIIIMISLIAVANVFNTISTNIKLRRRELAMLRSVGMSERSFQKMMNFECAFYGMRALILGLPIAIISSWLIFKGMVGGGADDIDFVLPWGSIGISVFLVVFITMLYAVSKIKKENIIDALRDDMS